LAMYASMGDGIFFCKNKNSSFFSSKKIMYDSINNSNYFCYSSKPSTMRILFTLLIISVSFQVQAQGSFSTIDSTGGGTFSNTRPRVALNKMNHPVVTWNRTTNKTISFSAHSGSSFNTPLTLTPNGVQADVFTWAGQEMASRQDTIYVTYASINGSESNAYVQRSVNGGLTFFDTVRASNIGTNKARFPAIAVNDNGKPMVMYMRMLSSWDDPRYVVAQSMNGVSYMPDVDASYINTGNFVCDCCPPAIVTKGNTYAALYRDNNSNQRDIRCGLSTNGGASFATTQQVDFNNWMLNACPSTGPDGHFGTDTLYTVFSSAATSPMQVYINTMHITNHMSNDKKILASTNMQQYPRIAGALDTIGIVWEEANKIMFTYSVQGTGGLSVPVSINGVDLGQNPDIAYANGKFHIVWQSNGGYVKYRYFDMFGAIGTEDILQNSFSIFPNPTKTTWTLQLKNQEKAWVSLYTVLGEKVFEKEISSGEKFPDKNLAEGFYYLNVIQQGKKSVGVLLKQ
jgi:Secretion system C-terminal sorting domain